MRILTPPPPDFGGMTRRGAESSAAQTDADHSGATDSRLADRSPQAWLAPALAACLLALAAIPQASAQLLTWPGNPTDQTYVAGRPIANIVFPEAAGGSLPYTYIVATDFFADPAVTDGGVLNSDDLPDGLMFDANTRTLSGTPTTPGTYFMEAGVEDNFGASVFRAFTITVLPAFTVADVPDLGFLQNQDIGMVQLPEATSGIGAKTYALRATGSSVGLVVGGNVDNDRIPLGLSFDPSTRTLSGAPTVVAQYNVRYRVTDEAGVELSQIFNLYVGTPIAAIDSQQDRTYLVGRPIERLMLPRTTGGVNRIRLRYSLRTEIPEGSTGMLDSSDNNLPAGLSLSGLTTLFLEGTPTAAGEYVLIYTARDDFGNSQEIRFRLNVVPALTLDAPADRTYRVGRQVSLVLSAGNGGLGDGTYGLTATTADGTLNAEDLPDGLMFNADTRTLSGAPTTEGTYAMTYTADDDSVDSALSQTFSIRVLPGANPTQRAVSEQVQQASALALAVSASRSVGDRVGQWLSGNLGTASVAADGSALSLPLTADGSVPRGGLNLWLRTGEQQLANAEGTLSWDGDLSETQLGFDGQIGDNLLLGLMLSQSDGSFGYLDSGSDAQRGDYSNEAQVLSPYLAWAIADGLNAWFMLSIGSGDLSLLDRAAERRSADFDLTTLLGGVDYRLLAGRVSTLRFKAELASISLDHLGAEPGATASTSDLQLRASLQSTHRFETAGGASWTPSAQVALRDNALGSGLEIGGSVRYLSADDRISVEAGLRTLEAGDYEETGTWLSLRWQVAADRRGLSFHLTPSSGLTQSRADTLWHKAAQPLQPTDDPNTATASRLSSEIAWGLATGPRSTLTPYSQWEQSATRTRRALGLRWQTGTHLQLSLESHRQHSHTTHPDQGLQLRGKLRF